MQSASSRIWTGIVVSISYEDKVTVCFISVCQQDASWDPYAVSVIVIILH